MILKAHFGGKSFYVLGRNWLVCLFSFFSFFFPPILIQIPFVGKEMNSENKPALSLIKQPQLNPASCNELCQRYLSKVHLKLRKLLYNQ